MNQQTNKMKKILLLLIVLAATIGASAQVVTKGDMPSLVGERKINVAFDYSAMTINSMSIADWLEYRQAEQPQYNAEYELESELKPSLTEEFVKAVNKKLARFSVFLVVSKEPRYTLTVVPQNVRRNGDNVTECVLTDKDGNHVATFTVDGSGGTFGSMANLWGDGFRSVGKKVGSLLVPCFK